MKKIEQIDSNDFIPCVFLRGASNQVLIHFHANGEDCGHTYDLITRY